jgi:hypothetical protein
VVVYIDVDDTLVRWVSTKRIPIPRVIDRVRSLHAEGAFCICGALVEPSTPAQWQPISALSNALLAFCRSQRSSSTIKPSRTGEIAAMSTPSKSLPNKP